MSTTKKLHDHIISLLNVFLKNKIQTFGKENIHDRPDITQLANTNIPLYNKSILLLQGGKFATMCLRRVGYKYGDRS